MSAQHLKPKWLNIAAALQAKAAIQNRNSILSINVVVDKSGNPLVWTEPVIKYISPRNHPTDWIRDLIIDE